MGCSCSLPHLYPPGGGRSVSVVRLRARARSTVSQLSTQLGVKKSSVKWPFEEREVVALMASWHSIRSNVDQMGVNIFTKMFRQSPSVKSIFEKFNGLEANSSELWRSDILGIHAMTVMNAIDDVMCNLDDRDVAIEVLLEQGQSHAHFGERMSEDVFWAIETPFLRTMEEVLGRKYKGDIKRLYEKAIHFILESFVLAFQVARRMASRVLGWGTDSLKVPTNALA